MAGVSTYVEQLCEHCRREGYCKYERESSMKGRAQFESANESRLSSRNVQVPSGENPRPSSDTLNPIVSRNVPVLLAALWDGMLWQDSLADAHYDSLMPCNRTPENTKVAKNARKQAKRYERLHDRIKRVANVRLTRTERQLHNAR